MYYLVFWVKKEKDHVDCTSDNAEIMHMLVKTMDSYVFAPSKYFTEIKHIKKQQYLDLTYPLYNREKLLSSVWLNILTSNKILYHQYFMDRGLVYDTKILSHKDTKDIANKNPNKYVYKVPYSSASYCVRRSLPIPKACFTGEGIIVQKIAKSLNFIELKFHTFRGEILFGVIHSPILKNSRLFIDRELKIHLNSKQKYHMSQNNLNRYIKRASDMILKSKKQLREKCKKIYNGMSELTLITKNKAEFERNGFIKDLGLDEEIFYSLFPQAKLNILRDMISSETDPHRKKKMESYKKFIKASPDQVKEILNLKIDEKDHLDDYMRLDYLFVGEELYLLEIEPFASGKGRLWPDKIKAPLNYREYDEKMTKKDSNQDDAFMHYVEKCLDIYLNTDIMKFDNLSKYR
jgi:hypothetical protein